MYAGRMRTLEQIEHRRAWKRQHNDNGRRIFYGADYQHMVATVELAQEINAACAAKAAELRAEFNARVREENRAFNDRLGPTSNGTPQPQEMEDTHRAQHRAVRVPRDLPQPHPPSQRTRNAHTARIREHQQPNRKRRLTLTHRVQQTGARPAGPTSGGQVRRPVAPHHPALRELSARAALALRDTTRRPEASRTRPASARSRATTPRTPPCC